jgi:S1-C subfamily serine protease
MRTAAGLFPFAGFILLWSISNVPAGESGMELLQRAERHGSSVYRRAAPAVVALSCRKGRMAYYGTGVVISPQGKVLTSTTVVPDGAHSIRVWFPDGRVFFSETPLTDEKTETAILTITRKGAAEENGGEKTSDAPQAASATEAFPFAPIGDSAACRVGDAAFTAGNPFHTIRQDGQVAWSAGTISAIYSLKSEDDQSRYEGPVLETDAAVNPGSDGGPLFDGEGRVLGVLSLCWDGSRLLGAAVPLHLIQARMQEAFADVPPIAAPRSTPEENRNAAAARAVWATLNAAVEPLEAATVKLWVHRAAGRSHRDPDGQAQMRRVTQALTQLLLRRVGPAELRRQSEDQLFALLADLRRRYPNIKPVLDDEALRGIAQELRRRLDAFDRPGDAPPQLPTPPEVPVPPEAEGNDEVPTLKKTGFDEERGPEPAAGVIVDPAGFVLTSAYNVSGDVRRIEVELFDGRKYVARILGRDRRLDAALLKLEALVDSAEPKQTQPSNAPLPFVPLSKGDDCEPGTYATVLGVSATGRRPSRTSGVISARGRFSEQLLQTDARINLGNTGGPAADLRGRLIGIAGFVGGEYRWGQSSGVGLIAPAAQLRKAWDDLVAGRERKPAVRAFIGIGPDLDAEATDGVVLGGIAPQSPAAFAGLRCGDVLMKLDDKPIESWNDLVRFLRRRNPGEKLRMTFRRGNVVTDAELVLAERKDE